MNFSLTKTLLCLGLAILGSILAEKPAVAQVQTTVYDWTFTGNISNGIVPTASGTFTVGPDSTIVDITGILKNFDGNDYTIIGRDPNAMGTYPLTTSTGVGFYTDQSSSPWLFYYNSPSSDYKMKYDDGFTITEWAGSATFTEQSVPEIDGNSLPKSLLLLACLYLMLTRWKKHGDWQPVPVNHSVGPNALAT